MHRTAIGIVHANPGAKFLASGINLLDHMKEDVMHPSELFDITRLKYAGIEKVSGTGISLGATATNAFTTDHETIRKNYPHVYY